MNATVNSSWWVASVGLAEIYQKIGDTDNAIELYKKSILLNKNNQWNYNEKINKIITSLTEIKK